jgi:hypothetical protein
LGTPVNHPNDEDLSLGTPVSGRAPPLKQEKSMEPTKTDPAVANDVLHLGGSKLTPEEIAKALAHHKHHHNGDQPQQAAAKAGGGKKGKSGK